jgi:hypothetical protein
MNSHTARMVTAARTEALTANDSDTVDLPKVAMGLFITTAGDIRFQDASGGGPAAVVALPVGLFPVQIKRIYATGLTAEGFVLYDK